MSDGAASIALDGMGPVVVNADGTLARVANWARMTEREREVAELVLVLAAQVRDSALHLGVDRLGLGVIRKHEETGNHQNEMKHHGYKMSSTSKEDCSKSEP